MKSGFTLIELILALLLASLVSVSLFQIFNQVGRAVKRISTTIAIDMPLIGFMQQFEKDITGMFTPESSLDSYIQKDKQEVKERDPFEKIKEKKNEPQPLTTKPVESVFYLEGTKDFFCSFITTGGVQVLDSDGNIAPIPLIRRVAYILEPDSQNENRFKLLYRYSSTQLELNAFRAPDFSPSLVLLANIKSCSLEVTVLSEKGVGQPQLLSEWKPQQMWQTHKTLIPAYVRLSGIRVDQTGIEYPFEMLSKVYAYHPYVEKEKSLFQALDDIAQKIWKKT